MPDSGSGSVVLNSSPVPSLETLAAPGCGCREPAVQRAVDPKSFFMEKMNSHDVVLLGAKHNQPSTSFFLIDILPVLAGFGVTHVGLEIASDQQPKLDSFACSGVGLDDIDIFHFIDRPEYRCFIDAVRLCELKPVAMDIPRSMWNEGYTRDEWMARNISCVFQRDSQAKMVVVVGNLHTLKRVDWIDSKKTEVFLPSYIPKYEPEIKSLSVLSDYNDCPGRCCKIRKQYESAEKPVVLDAAGLEFRPGVMDIIAAKPLDIDQMTDAVMMY